MKCVSVGSILDRNMVCFALINTIMRGVYDNVHALEKPVGLNYSKGHRNRYTN